MRSRLIAYVLVGAALAALVQFAFSPGARRLFWAARIRWADYDQRARLVDRLATVPPGDWEPAFLADLLRIAPGALSATASVVTPVPGYRVARIIVTNTTRGAVHLHRPWARAEPWLGGGIWTRPARWEGLPLCDRLEPGGQLVLDAPLPPPDPDRPCTFVVAACLNGEVAPQAFPGGPPPLFLGMLGPAPPCAAKPTLRCDGREMPYVIVPPDGASPR